MALDEQQQFPAGLASLRHDGHRQRGGPSLLVVIRSVLMACARRLPHHPIHHAQVEQKMAKSLRYIFSTDRAAISKSTVAIPKPILPVINNERHSKAPERE